MFSYLTIYITNHGIVYRMTTNEIRREVLEETGMGWLVIAKYQCYKNSYISRNSFRKLLSRDMDFYIKSREKKNKKLDILNKLKDILDVL